MGNAESHDAGFECLVAGGELITVSSSAKGDRDGKTLVAVFGTVHLPHGRAFGEILYQRLTSLLEKDVIVVSVELLFCRVDSHFSF